MEPQEQNNTLTKEEREKLAFDEIRQICTKYSVTLKTEVIPRTVIIATEDEEHAKTA